MDSFIKNQGKGSDFQRLLFKGLETQCYFRFRSGSSSGRCNLNLGVFRKGGTTRGRSQDTQSVPGCCCFFFWWLPWAINGIQNTTTFGSQLSYPKITTTQVILRKLNWWRRRLLLDYGFLGCVSKLICPRYPQNNFHLDFNGSLCIHIDAYRNAKYFPILDWIVFPILTPSKFNIAPATWWLEACFCIGKVWNFSAANCQTLRGYSYLDVHGT